MKTAETFPRIRISRVELQNFKGVKHGVIEFNCLKHPVERDIQADMLALYGQNGSGKTTLLEALNVACFAMRGRKIPASKYAGLISQDSDYARMTLGLLVQNADGSKYNVDYAFSLGLIKVENKQDSNQQLTSTTKRAAMIVGEALASDTIYTTVAGLTPVIFSSAKVLASLSPAVAAAAGTLAAMVSLKEITDKEKNRKKAVEESLQMIIFDELLSLSGEFNGEIVRYGPIFDTHSEEEPFVPKAKQSAFFPINTSESMKKLAEHKEQAMLNSKSFIFGTDVSKMILSEGDEITEYGQLILDLKAYALRYLRIIDTRNSDINNDDKIIIYTSKRGVSINKSDSSTYLDDEGLNTLKNAIEGLNIILKQLIPGLSLEAIRQVDVDIDNNNRIKSEGTRVIVYSVRNDVRIPISEESTGILRIISALGYISYAFATEGVTVAIDEIDAGVYEYLLGELLLVFEEYGYGQLIFTCHNLRPLELLDKKFIYFTTINPENRYLKPKNIRYGNNLRKVYLEEIVRGGQEEELYSSSKHGKIAAALQKAGEVIGKS